MNSSIRQDKEHLTRTILFVPGSGDVQGTYDYWRRGELDPRIPSTAYSSQVYEAAKNLGYRLVVLTEHKGAVARQDEFATFVPVIEPKASGVAYHKNEIAFSRRIVREYRDRQCSALIVQRYMQHLWPLRSLVARCPHSVLSFHNTLWPKSLRPSLKVMLLSFLNRETIRLFKNILCVSPEIERQIKKVAGSEIKTFLHFPQYDEDRIARIDKANGRFEEIVYAGRIERNKGVFDLLEAFELLPAELQRVLRIAFVGKGSALAELRRKASGCMNRDNIRFYEDMSGIDVLTRIASSKVLVCPTQSSFAEGLAKTPIEAALVGIPSIVSDVVPALEVLGDAAVSFPPGDAPSLSVVISSVLLDDELYRAAVLATSTVSMRAFSPEHSFGYGVSQALRG